MGRLLAFGGLMGALCLAGCPDDSEPTSADVGATCDTSITYEKHIAPFMETYCTGCHASSLAPSERNGAPSDHDLDSEAAVLEYPGHLIDVAGAGPDGVNDSMPPKGYAQPSLNQRRMLASYLTCYEQGVEPDGHTHGH